MANRVLAKPVFLFLPAHLVAAHVEPVFQTMLLLSQTIRRLTECRPCKEFACQKYLRCYTPRHSLL